MTKKFKFPIEIIQLKDYAMPTFVVNIDCDDLIDWISYHDAPSAINWYANRDDLINLRKMIDEVLGENNDS